MKRLIYSILGICLMTSLTFADKVESKKVFEEHFNSIQNTSLYLNNKYGDIIIANWDKDEISIKCEIIVKAKNKKLADEFLAYITSEIGKSQDSVFAVTHFDKKFKNNSKVDIDIKYTVKAPAHLAYNINNKYGNIAISKITGKTKINLKYGNMLAKRLEFTEHKKLNNIYLAYSNATIGYCNYADIEIKYGKIKLDRAKALLMNSRYSDVTIGTLETLHFDGKYGGLSVDSINIAEIEVKYMNIEMQYLRTKLNTEIKYGNLEVKNIEPNFNEIDIEAAYGNVELLIHPDAVYSLSADVDYGSLDLPKRVNINKSINSNSEEVEGVVGPKGKTITGKVSIEMDYGNVEL